MIYRGRVAFKVCSPPGSLLKVVKRSLTISFDDEKESVPKKKKEIRTNYLNARQFQFRRSEQGFTKSSAFKLYRFHFICEVSCFPPTGEITDSPQRSYVFDFRSRDAENYVKLQNLKALYSLYLWANVSGILCIISSA